MCTECDRETEEGTKPCFTFPLSIVVATRRINFENDTVKFGLIPKTYYGHTAVKVENPFENPKEIHADKDIT